MRMIDADALRESIITRQTEMSYEDAWALTCVDNAPTIEPQKWIPVSERLPEIPKGCDVYWCSECGDVAADEYIVMIKGATLPTALFWDGKHWFDINGEQTLFPVIAWMTFPEAYKEDNNA